jgi:hypothetical protein
MCTRMVRWRSERRFCLLASSVASLSSCSRTADSWCTPAVRCASTSRSSACSAASVTRAVDTSLLKAARSLMSCRSAAFSASWRSSRPAFSHQNSGKLSGGYGAQWCWQSMFLGMASVASRD